MTRLIRRGLAAALTLLVVPAVAGCSAGGFGSSHPEASEHTIKRYVAIGDGYAAAPFIGTVDKARGCLRSASNYPAQVAEKLGAELIDVTCTGADTTAVLDGQKAPTGKGRLPAQLDAVTADTDLVTITVGAMDDDLLYRGFYVCMGFPCAENTIPATKLGTEVAQSGDRVDDIVRKVQSLAPRAQVVLVSYPQISPREQTCSKLPPMDELQLVGVNAMFDSLNGNMQDAAGATAADYINLATVSADHDVCATVPWVRGIRPPEGPKAVLHPLAAEQKAAADAVIAVVQRQR